MRKVSKSCVAEAAVKFALFLSITESGIEGMMKRMIPSEGELLQKQNNFLLLFINWHLWFRDAFLTKPEDRPVCKKYVYPHLNFLIRSCVRTIPVEILSTKFISHNRLFPHHLHQTGCIQKPISLSIPRSCPAINTAILVWTIAGIQSIYIFTNSFCMGIPRHHP